MSRCTPASAGSRTPLTTDRWQQPQQLPQLSQQLPQLSQQSSQLSQQSSQSPAPGVDGSTPPVSTLSPSSEPHLPSQGAISLREFLRDIDGYASIYYMAKAGLPPAPQTDPRLARVLALATQKFIADIAANAYQHSLIRDGSNTGYIGSVSAVTRLPISRHQAGGRAGSKDGQGKGGPPSVSPSIQRPGRDGFGQDSTQNRTVLTMEDLGLAMGEYGVNIQRREFRR
ncbi:Transcription initiation factor TFIID subunit 10 [Purpureocillium lavendulum]|uniref:Transcription initiation factor TFIID subunit 10 n=1 Tax=Purpureocillium lavendulum TaxID=1247861 RepID=A0AB34FAP3_9HYPO|nr:Transcription initiation factor TFIID subunit 10 [Purpureocillium lavendulum]